MQTPPPPKLQNNNKSVSNNNTNEPKTTQSVTTTPMNQNQLSQSINKICQQATMICFLVHNLQALTYIAV